MAKSLKDLLKGVENAEEVERIIKQNLRDESCKLFIDDGEENIYVPKSRLDSKIAELRAANDTINNLTDQLDGFNGNPKDADTIKNLKAEVKNYQAQLKQVQLDNAITNMAKDVNAKDVKDVKAFLDMSQISLDTNGNVLGLKEQVDALVESKPYLFNEQQSQQQVFGGTGAPGKPSNEYLFGSKTMHEGDFGKMLAQSNNVKESNQVDSDYFFKNN